MAELDDKVIVTKDKITTIADTIREEGGTSDLMTLDEMPDNIRAIGGGGSADVKRLGITLANNTATFNLNGYEVWQLIGSNKTIVADITYTDGNNSTSYNKSCTASLKSEASDTQTRIEASVVIYKNYTFYTRYFNMVIGASSMEYTGTYAVTDIVIPEEEYVDPLFTLTYPSTITCNKTFAQISSYYGAGNTKPVAPQLIYKYSSGDDTAFRSVYGEVEQYDEDTFIFTFNMGYARGVDKTQWQEKIVEIQYERGDSLSKIDDYTLEYQKPVVAGNGIELENVGTGINRKTQISVVDTLMIRGSANGSVASFDDGADDLPLKSCIVEIDSTDGVSDCNLTICGKNYSKTIGTTTTFGNVLFTVNNDGTCTVNGTANGWNAVYRNFGQAKLKANTPYILTSEGRENDLLSVSLYNGDTRIATTQYADYVNFTLEEDAICELRVIVHYNATVSNRTIKPMIRLASETDTKYEPYNTNSQTYNIEFVDGSTPLTVHDGELDVVTGVLTVNDTTPSTTYNLTPTEVKTLLGINNIFADCGDVDVEYVRDATSIINWLISQINLGA